MRTITVAARATVSPMTEAREYILGTDDVELQRLGLQHQVWVSQQWRMLERAGLRAGHAVLDLGCGPGFTTFELAHVVGPNGRVVARDTSARFLRHLQHEAKRRGMTQIETSEGTAEELALPNASLDAAYSRWLLCWLPDPGRALRAVARALRPGGFVMVQEYLDWAAMKMIPRSAAFDRAVAACMRGWELGGGHIDVGERIPALAAECGLRVESFEPIARAGAVGSPVWRWIESFHRTWLPRVVERALLATDEMQRLFAEYDTRNDSGDGRLCAPTMVDIVLRRP
jgi:SAM-dependent methyltransferase